MPFGSNAERRLVIAMVNSACAKHSYQVFLLPFLLPICCAVSSSCYSPTPNSSCSGCGCYSDRQSCLAAGCLFHFRCVEQKPAASCSVRMNRGTPYACTPSMDDARSTLELCNQRRLQPFSKYMFEGGWASGILWNRKIR